MRDRCEFFLERLGRYLDGELEPKSAREMEDHLRSCPRCRRAHEEMLVGDRLLRDGVNAEATDEGREEKAAARLLARLREEPEPEWARRRGSAGRAIGFGGWRRIANRIRSRRLGPTLGWAGGLAAATAAVLLAIRLGMPERPVVTDAFRKEKVEQAPVERDLGQEPGRSGSGRPRAAEAPPDPESAILPAAPSPGSSMPSSEASPSLRVEADAAKAPQEAPPQAQEGIEVEDSREARTPVAAVRGGQAAETILKTDEPQAAPPEENARAKTTVEGEKKDTDKGEDRHAAVPTRAGRASAPTETWGGIRNYTEAPAAEGANFALQADVIDSTEQGIFSPSDTLTTAAELAVRLERGSGALNKMSDSDLEPAERARRWRVIGDLWEWLARRDGVPVFFERALQAYEMGVALDPEAGAPDPIRVARALAGAGTAPNPAGPGNKIPLRR